MIQSFRELLFIIFCAFLISSCAENTESRQLEDISEKGLSFVRQSDGNERLIIFVHGITSNSLDAWKNSRTGAYWPELLVSDETFDSSDIAVYGYPTSGTQAGFSIDEISSDFLRSLSAGGVPENYTETVFIAHSMGGLVVREFVLSHRDFSAKPMMIHFFGTPTNGSTLANLASIVSNSGQTDALRDLQDNNFLRSQSSQWLSSPFKDTLASYCAYETRNTSGVLVVPRASATALCNRRFDPIAEDHVALVKPSGTTSSAYLAFKVAYSETFEKAKFVSGNDVVEVTSAQDFGNDSIIVANAILFKNSVALPPDALIIANDVQLGEDVKLTGSDITIVAATVSGGTIDVTGDPGKPGGSIAFSVGRVSGVELLADGGDGLSGSNGADGLGGRDGDNGRDGRCDGFGRWRSAQGGSNGTDGTDGQDGENGFDGGDGGSIYLATLSSEVPSTSIQGGQGGPSGRGGRPGLGGRGGRGGSGCTGLGGSQDGKADGSDGRDGTAGREGLPGNDGRSGRVWVNQLALLKSITAILPEDRSQFDEYGDDIRSRVRVLARRGS